MVCIVQFLILSVSDAGDPQDLFPEQVVTRSGNRGGHKNGKSRGFIAY